MFSGQAYLHPREHTKHTKPKISFLNFPWLPCPSPHLTVHLPSILKRFEVFYSFSPRFDFHCFTAAVKGWHENIPLIICHVWISILNICNSCCLYCVHCSLDSVKLYIDMCFKWVDIRKPKQGVDPLPSSSKNTLSNDCEPASSHTSDMVGIGVFFKHIMQSHVARCLVGGYPSLETLLHC